MRTWLTVTAVVVLVAVGLLPFSRPATADPPALVSGVAAGAIALADVTASRISYQGRLTDAGGSPLDGSYNLLFQLWDDSAAGSQVGGDVVRAGVQVANGLFTVELDVPQSAFNGQALWLRIRVNDEWLSPRQALLPVPYALSLRPGAQVSGTGTDTITTVINQGGGTALAAFSNSGWGLSVGSSQNTAIYATAGTVPLMLITGRNAMVGFGQDNGIVAWGGQTGGSFQGSTGVSGSGTTYGVRGTTDSTQPAVLGENTADSGGAGGVGVRGTAAGYDGKGVEGSAGFGTGVLGSGEIGVKGTSGLGFGVQGTGPTGVDGRSQIGVGVNGVSTQADGVRGYGAVNGVYGEASNFGGQGVFGVGKGDNAEGVLGTSEGSTGIGVYGYTGAAGDGVRGMNSGTGDGVHGIASDGGKSGVYGESTAGFGVTGRSTSSAGVQGFGPTGVYGESNTVSGQAVAGLATALAAEGVLGTATGQNGEGVAGYGRGAGSSFGVRGTSSNSYGVYGETDLPGGYGIYTPDRIYAGGGCVACTPALIAKNGGEETLEAGDVVVVAGIAPPLSSRSTQPVVLVRKAGAGSGQAVIGAVEGHYVSKPVDDKGQLVEDARTTDQPVPPGAYLTVVYQGLARVKVDAAQNPMEAGDRVGPAGADGVVRKLDALAPASPVLGRALEPLSKGTGLVWVLLAGR